MEQNIAIRHEGNNWAVASAEEFPAESEMQDVLAATPGLLPMGAVRASVPDEPAAPLVVLGKEIHCIDLLATDRYGWLYIVECKRRVNADKRQILAQLVDYASRLSGLSFDSLDADVRRFNGGQGMLDLLCAADPEACTEEAQRRFHDEVAASLRCGIFRLFVVMDAIPSEVQRMAEFLNRFGQEAAGVRYPVGIFLFEIARFRAESSLAVAVHHVDARVPITPAPPLRTTPHAAEGDFWLAAARVGSEAVARALVDTARERGLTVDTGPKGQRWIRANGRLVLPVYPEYLQLYKDELAGLTDVPRFDAVLSALQSFPEVSDAKGYPIAGLKGADPSMARSLVNAVADAVKGAP